MPWLTFIVFIKFYYVAVTCFLLSPLSLFCPILYNFYIILYYTRTPITSQFFWPVIEFWPVIGAQLMGSCQSSDNRLFRPSFISFQSGANVINIFFRNTDIFSVNMEKFHDKIFSVKFFSKYPHFSVKNTHFL